MGPRWKRKGAEAEALSKPMSKIVSELQTCLLESDAKGMLTTGCVLLQVEADRGQLLTQACFGFVNSSEKNKLWIRLGFEEAFYLCHYLKCLKVVDGHGCLKSDSEIWQYMKDKEGNFPVVYKAYSHLRSKNWVVRPGLNYGVDFLVYRHHPSLVHSEYAVLVLQVGDGEVNGRLKSWSDVHGAVRLTGSVAKQLLVLYISKNGHGDLTSESLENYSVHERTTTRWSPKGSREDHTTSRNGAKPSQNGAKPSLALSSNFSSFLLLLLFFLFVCFVVQVTNV